MAFWIASRRACALTLGMVLVAGVSAAGEAEQRQAQSLFDQARKLLEAGDAAQACPLFAESQRLDPGGGTLLNLAACHEKEGRVATAYAEYQEALSIALRDGRRDRESIARDRAKALEARLPKLRVQLEKAERGVVFVLDGAPLTDMVQQTPTALDPGPHELKVSAPGFRQRVLAFEASEGKLSLLQVPALEPETEAGAGMAPEPPTKAVPTPAPTPHCAPGSRLEGTVCVSARKARHFSTASYVVGASGLVLLGASAITGALALSKNSSAQDSAAAACVPGRNFCPDPARAAAAKDDADQARTLAWVSTGALVLGAAAVTTAWFLPRAEVTAEAVVVPGGMALSATRRF
jgi:hypothetical protein